MADQTISTATPQIGDGIFEVNARAAKSLVSIVGSLATLYTETAYLASAARTTYTSGAVLTVPAGVVGVIVRLYVTAVPGGDTVNISIADALSGRGMHTGGVQVAAANCFTMVKTGGSLSVPSGTAITPGIPEKIFIAISHSGAGSFTYSVTYCWLTQ